MDTRILFIRHGNSEATNIYLPGRMPGVHLSPVGIAEATRLAEDLGPVHIDKIFSSPLERTRETANIIASAKKLDIEILDDFLEIDFGTWSGKSFNELKQLDEWKKFSYFRINTRPPQGESIIEVQSRVIRGVGRMLKSNTGKTMAIVSHGDPIRSAIAFYIGLPLDLMSRIKILTASVSILRINDDGCELQCLNYRGNILNEVLGI
jgi:broad specificity phosphatase PhoE